MNLSVTGLILLLLTGQTLVAREPAVLDLSKHYAKGFDALKKRLFKPIWGEQTLDGLPFHIGGEMPLEGRTPTERKKVYPKSYTGVVVGRAFEELHLIHMTHWVDVEGGQLATATLHYEDGTAQAFPLCYGVHVRDQSRLLTEESDRVSDAGSRVIWRGPGDAALKATLRLFKTTLVNPKPEKVVATIDFTAMPGCLASYALMAATVSDRDAARALTSVPKEAGPERKFEGKITVAVLDRETGLPLPGALVQVGLNVEEVYLVASPVLTDGRGMAVVKYPRGTTDYIRLEASQAGSQKAEVAWSGNEGFPESHVFRLDPEE